MTTYTIKPLDWTENADIALSYAQTVLGRYRVGFRGDETWGWGAEYGGDGGFADIEAAKSAAEVHYRERILTALEVVG